MEERNLSGIVSSGQLCDWFDGLYGQHVEVFIRAPQSTDKARWVMGDDQSFSGECTTCGQAYLADVIRELKAERDLLIVQLEAMRKSRDDLARALEFLTNSSPASSPV